MSLSAEEIENKILKINKLIEELEPVFEKGRPKEVSRRIRFPHGVIKRTNTYRAKLPIIENNTLKTNVAYSLQLANVYIWILDWFNIIGIAREMFIKHGIILLVSIMEALVHCFVDNYLDVDVHKRLKRNLKKLLDEGVLNKREHKNFDRCRFLRDSIHLQNIGERELEKYDENDFYFVRESLNIINNIFISYLQEKNIR